MGADSVKIFCPKCQCVYHPPPMRYRSSHGTSHGSAAVDGAAFGTTFAHLFLMTFNNLVPDGLSQESVYVPKVFGFRVHPSARQRSGNPNTSAAIGGGGSAVKRTLNTLTSANQNMQTNTGGPSTNGNGDGPGISDDRKMDASLPQQRSGKVDSFVSKPAKAILDGESGSQSKSKKGKGRKSKSDETGASAKRRGKNGDNEGNSNQKSKRMKRP